MGFPPGSVVKNLPANARDPGSTSGLGRSHKPRSNYAHVLQLLRPCGAAGEACILQGVCPPLGQLPQGEASTS